MTQLPAIGGSYVRDPETGALRRSDQGASAPKATEKPAPSPLPEPTTVRVRPSRRKTETEA